MTIDPKTYHKKYYQEHKEQFAAYGKKRRATHPEEIKRNKLERYHKNREMFRYGLLS